MAFITKFQRLFAVKLLHGFYLDGVGNQTFFGLPSGAKQKMLAAYDAKTVFTIKPTVETEKNLKNHRIKWAIDEQGFFVGIEMDAVKPTTPLKPLPFETHLTFVLSAKSAYFPNITNMRLATTDILPFKFYFTNTDSSQKTYPSVSMPLESPLNRHYEMGECVKQAGQIWEAIESNNGFSATNGTWRKLEPNTDFHYAHTGDRKALGKQFSLRFKEKVVKTVTAILKDNENKVLKTIEVKSPERLSVASFDFSAYEADITEGGQKRKIRIPIRDGVYKLSMTGDFSLAETKVFLSDTLTASDIFGIVDIVHQNGLPIAFRIQNDDKTLPNEQPQFEVRFQSRLTYRQFFDNASKHIFKHFRPLVDTDFDYNQVTDVLIKKSADRLALSPLGLKITGDGGLPLPEPTNLNLAMNPAKTQFISEIQY
jgi:hypothetical protein